jgi:hypothetical protein
LFFFREKEILSDLTSKPIYKKKAESKKNKNDDFEMKEVNEDDNNNNRYLEPVPKFPHVSENEPMLKSRDVRYTEV